jgi:hypothetical protein
MFQFVLGFSAGAAFASFLAKGGHVLAHGELTPPRKKVLSHLLANVHGPDQLRKMAKMFGAEGLKAPAAMLEGKAKQVEQQAEIAEEWCIRARACDQNAIASIAEARNEAAKGNPRAQVSCWLIERWLNLNPVTEEAPPSALAMHGSFAAGEPPLPEEAPTESAELH